MCNCVNEEPTAHGHKERLNPERARCSCRYLLLGKIQKVSRQEGAFSGGSSLWGKMLAVCRRAEASTLQCAAPGIPIITRTRTLGFVTGGTVYSL